VFSPNGTRVIIASFNKTARVWDVRPDTRTPNEWSAIAEQAERARYARA